MEIQIILLNVHNIIHLFKVMPNILTFRPLMINDQFPTNLAGNFFRLCFQGSKKK